MPTVLYEKRYPIAYVTLNRPETLNAINTEMNQELERAWYDFDADQGLWIAILTATGDKAFSSGAECCRAEPDCTGAVRMLVVRLFLWS